MEAEEREDEAGNMENDTGTPLEEALKGGVTAEVALGASCKDGRHFVVEQNPRRVKGGAGSSAAFWGKEAEWGTGCRRSKRKEAAAAEEVAGTA